MQLISLKMLLVPVTISWTFLTRSSLWLTSWRQGTNRIHSDRIFRASIATLRRSGSKSWQKKRLEWESWSVIWRITLARRKATVKVHSEAKFRIRIRLRSQSHRWWKKRTGHRTVRIDISRQTQRSSLKLKRIHQLKTAQRLQKKQLRSSITLQKAKEASWSTLRQQSVSKEWSSWQRLPQVAIRRFTWWWASKMKKAHQEPILWLNS